MFWPLWTATLSLARAHPSSLSFGWRWISKLQLFFKKPFSLSSSKEVLAFCKLRSALIIRSRVEEVGNFVWAKFYLAAVRGEKNKLNEARFTLISIAAVVTGLSILHIAGDRPTRTKWCAIYAKELLLRSSSLTSFSPLGFPFFHFSKLREQERNILKYSS